MQRSLLRIALITFTSASTVALVCSPPASAKGDASRADRPTSGHSIARIDTATGAKLTTPQQGRSLSTVMGGQSALRSPHATKPLGRRLK